MRSELNGHEAGHAWIYFIRNERCQAVKIGTSSDPERRLVALQTANADPLELLATFPGDHRVEAALHRRFAAHRREGEWFDDCEAIGITIRAMERGRDPLRQLFLDGKVMEPDLCYITSRAVGFAVSIYWGAGFLTGADHNQYQVMRWDEAPGRGHDFWNWYLWEMWQWFDTPVEAASEFVRWWHEWLRQGRSPL